MVASETQQPAFPNPPQQSSATFKKTNPSKERRKFSRLLDRMGTSQLDTARETVASMHLPASELQCALANTVDHQEHVASDLLTIFHGFMNKVVSHGVDVAVVGGNLAIPLRYKDQLCLSAEDEKLVEVFHHTWTKYMEACCRLALTEVAWEITIRQGTVENNIEAQATPSDERDLAGIPSTTSTVLSHARAKDPGRLDDGEGR